MAKRILNLHPTILSTRPRHPHWAARRCGSGAGSQQCVTVGLLAVALPALWPSDAAAHTCDAPFATDLVTGKGIDVGQVTVCNDAEFLTVTYETTFPWCVLRTNLHVARDLAGIPKYVVAPNWQRFDFIEDVDCGGEVTFDIPLDEVAGGIVPGDSVVIAARAVVEGEGPDGTHPRCLLGDKCVAWGKGTRFRPRLPATYFSYKVQEAAVPCPEACIAGLEAFAAAVAGDPFNLLCVFDTARQAGSVSTSYLAGRANVSGDTCAARNRGHPPCGIRSNQRRAGGLRALGGRYPARGGRDQLRYLAALILIPPLEQPATYGSSDTAAEPILENSCARLELGVAY